jgi:hypothetical protein
MSTYEAGQKYRVIREGARLTGMVPVAPYCQQGWSKQLHVGDVITCAGSGMTFGDGVPALKWKDEDGEWLANDCTFQPVQGGMWSGQIPEDGYLQQV